MRHVHRTAVAVLLAVVVAAPFAAAQKPKKKKGTQPAATDSASAAPSDTAPAATPAPEASDSASAGTGDTAAAGANAPAAKPEPEEPSPQTGEGTMTDVTEKDITTYYFIGLRYRGTIIPKFIMNLFVDEGGTFYSNSIGVEADLRKDHFSLIPALSYTEYGTGGPVLFLQKGKDANVVGNWSYVDSSLKAIYATADLLWSTRVHKNIDFEYGVGFGLGVIFGDLVTNWVYQTPAGQVPQFTSSDGRHFNGCTVGQPSPPTGPLGPPGCNGSEHQNSSVAKVNGYTEPSWVNGGSKPNIFPWIAIPQLGLRFKPIKAMEARLSLGFSLTGFWFGLSADYGLEKPEKK